MSIDIYPPETPAMRHDAAKKRVRIEPAPDSLGIFGSEGKRSAAPAAKGISTFQPPPVNQIFANVIAVPNRTVPRPTPAVPAPRLVTRPVASIALAVGVGIVVGALLMRFGGQTAPVPAPATPAVATDAGVRAVPSGGINTPPVVVVNRPVENRASPPAAERPPSPRAEQLAAVSPGRPDPGAARPSSGPTARTPVVQMPKVPVASVNAAAIGALPQAPVPAGVAPAATAATEGADAPDGERRNVRAVVDAYKSAYDRLDPAAAAALWPGVDTGALSRAFGALTSQRVTLDHCEIGILGVLSSARCSGAVEYVRRGGDATSQRRPISWVFALTQTAGQWQITKVSTR